MSKASIETDMRDYGLSYPVSKQTNADRIRNMSDEELADMMFESCIEKMGFEECKYSDGGINACKKCVLEWLQAEVKEGAE